MLPELALPADPPAAGAALDPEPPAATPNRAAAAVTARAILLRFIVVSFCRGHGWLGSRRCAAGPAPEVSPRRQSQTSGAFDTFWAVPGTPRNAGPAPEPCPRRAQGGRRGEPPKRSERSEEHTSELQSRQYLVCRLL